MAEAMSFCRKKGLITAQEEQQAKSREEVLRLAAKARIRMELYLKAHPEEK